MQELAQAGARVLNAQAVEFARTAGIAIYARQTGSESEGTVVRRDAPAARSGVRAVAHQSRVLWLEASGGRWDGLLGILDEHHAPADQMWCDGSGARASLSLENLHGADALVARLESALGEGGHIHQDFGSVSLVGMRLGATHRVLRRSLGALQRADITQHAWLGSAMRLTWIVGVGQVAGAAQALHREFLEAEGPG
jgi:aspartate kinase